MTLYKNDIITRRERNGRYVVWIAETALLRLLKGLDSIYLRVKVRPLYKKALTKKQQQQRILFDNGNSWRWAKIKGIFYYDYDRIPDDSKAKYKSHLPEKDKLIELYNNSLSERRMTKFETMVKQALDEVYKEYLHCYRAYKKAARTNLSKACAVLQVAVEYINEQEINVSRNKFFIEFSEVVKRYKVPYLPKNYRRLKDKIMKILDGSAIAEIIDLPRRGNSNSLKYNDSQLLAWIYTLRNDPRNYTNSYIIRKVMQLSTLLEKAVPSESWFNNLLAEHKTKFLTAAGRFGSKGRKANIYQGYIPLEGALHAGDCWQADGTRVNIIGHKNEDGSEKFLYIIAIRDVHSGDLVGVHLDTKEDRWGYVNALRMAVEFTGYLPYELVIDRFPGHQTVEWKAIQQRMETAGVKMTTTSLATGKAAVERMFGTIQTVFMQDSEYYYGEGIQSRRDYAHRTSEYLYNTRKRAKKQGWDFDKAWQETMQIIDNYRNTKLSKYSRKFKTIDLSPKQMHDQSEKPNVVKADILLRMELFGLEKKVTLKRLGIITTEIQRVTYNYQVDDYEVIAHHKDIMMKYDMEDLSKVYLFDMEGVFLTIAEETRKVQKYGPDADVKELSKAKKRIKEIDKIRKADLEQITAAGELDLLMGGLGNKDSVSSAETDWLLDRMHEVKDTGKPKLSDDILEEEEIEIDVRSQY